MLEYSWPGNVREMENAIESAFYLSQGYKISLQSLPKTLTAGIEVAAIDRDQGTLKERLAIAEKEILLEVLAACDGNRQHAAKMLGIGKTTIYDKLSRYQLSSEAFID